MTRRARSLAALAGLLLITASMAVFYFRGFIVRSFDVAREVSLLEISVLDVGQGDAILLEAPDGQTMLIDGGPDRSVLRRLGEELPFWERRIDLMVLTHPHEDHLAGLNAVIDRYEVGAVMISGAEAKSPSYKRFLEIIQQKAIPLYIVEHPEAIAFGKINISLLFPLHSLRAKRLANLNDCSIVIKVVYGDFEMLLTGDAETAIEKELLASGADLSADILKAGHHGSETSSGEEFLEAVSPETAIISSGASNSYGHPSPRILKRYERLHIPVHRTDQEGTVHVTTEGLGYEIF